MAEKNLNEMPPDERRMFTKGNEALQRENYDYAIELFSQVLSRHPEFHDCRKALRATQLAKAGTKTTGFFKKVMSTAGSSPQVLKAQNALRNNPAEALVIAEHILNADPQSSGAHKVVVEAANALDLPRTAAMSLDILFQNNPRDRDLAIRFANVLADVGEVERGEKILMDLVRAKPNDPELSQALKNISARRTMDEGGYDALADGKGSFRDILKDKEEAVTLEQEGRVQKTEDVAARLIAEYESRLKTEPDNQRLVRQLAELYTQKKDFARAIECYGRVKATDIGGDASLDRAIADTVAKRFDHEAAQLDVTATDHTERVAQLNAEKMEFQIGECRKRVEKFPTDLLIRFEMGALFFQAGKIAEAIQEFQKAQNNPHKRIPAMNFLGQCYAKRKMFDMAARALQNALKEKPVFDDEKKDLIYNLGCVLESMNKKEEAIEQFKQIYEVDIGYRDVGAKVDAYYAAQ